MKKDMKILVGGIYHESHSFSSEPTDIETFKKALFLEDDDSIEKLRDTTSEMSGFIKGAEKFGFEMIPTLWAWGVSTGPVKSETLDYLIDVVLQKLKKTGRVDGILFTLHGAMVSENFLDGDGYILSKLREFVGDGIPIAITLDLHANISELMVQKADVMVGYDTYPHEDQVERGLEAAELLVKTIKAEIKPTMHLEKPQMIVVPNMQLTDAHPMEGLIKHAHQVETENGVLSVTVAGGFAYSDVPEIGPGILVVTDNDPELAETYAKEITRHFNRLKKEFVPKLPSVSEAVKRAVESQSHPVILADVGDNIGAGTPGDSTFILKELRAQNATSAVVTIADAEAVRDAIAAGIGNIARFSIGGKTDKYHGEPVILDCRVKLLSDGVFCNRGQMRDGIVENMGCTAVVESGEITIVLTEIKIPPWNLEQLRSIGIEPKNKKIIVLKSAVAFRAAYEPIAGKIIEVNSPGLSSIDLRQFNYTNVKNTFATLNQKETGDLLVVEM